MTSRSFASADRWGKAWRRCARRWRPFARRIGRATGWKVWNPGLYGERWHARFRRLYPPAEHPLVIFGLNPGPYGMAQTGIPFTDIRRLASDLHQLARELRAAGEGLRLPGLAPASLRPYLSRTFEASAMRVYRFLEHGWGSAERGWREVVVANPCPLLFIDPSGMRNRTPADLGRGVRRRFPRPSLARNLLAECDRLRRVCARDAVETLTPRGAILLGKDVQAVLHESLARSLGEAAVLDWEHPARAVPEKWALELLGVLRRRGLLPAR